MATALEYGLIAASISVATITSATAVSLRGTVLPGVRVRLSDGGTELGTVVADANGNWNVDTTGLSNGLHIISGEVIDEAGNVVSNLPPRFLVVDATAPAAAPVASVTRADGAALGTLTAAQAVSLSGTAEPGATVHVFDGATLVGTATADANGTWSVAATNLAEGAHSFTTTVTDAAGNTSTASPVRDLTVDATAPVTAAVAAVTRPDGVAVEAVTNTRDVTLSGTAEAGATVHVFDGATLIGTATADANGNWSVAATGLADGTYSFSTTVTDAVGNTSTVSAARDLRVDATAPIASVVAEVKRDGGITVGATTNVKDVTMSGTAEAGATVRVFDGATLIGTATADANGAWSVAATGLADRTYSFSTTVTDAAGNTSAASPLRALTVDTAAPAPAAVAAFSPDSGIAGDGVTNAKTVTLSGTAEAGATVRVFDGTTAIGSAIADATGAWRVEATGLTEGPHSFTTTATDAAGNTSAASAPFGVRVDTGAPVITSNGGGDTASVSVRENTKTVTAVAATDARPGNLTYAIVGGADRDLFMINGATGALAFLAAPDHERPMDAGGHNIYDVIVEARDVDGNVDTQALAVTVTNDKTEVVSGDAGDNVFAATTDFEAFLGFGGSDTVSYGAALSGVAASLANPFTNRGEAKGDFYSSIENLKGSAFNDKLTGDFRANVLEGGAGGDWLDGGRGRDTASYANATSGVTADLAKSTNNSGEATGDIYRSIENIVGSDHADKLAGDSCGNVLDGRGGADTLLGRNGNDRMIGGLGEDLLSGGRGRDSYVYRTAQEGGDTIQDYVVKDDTLVFSASGFGGGLVAGQAPVAGVTFISGASPVAPTTSGTFLYDTVAQDLFWDVDGSDPGAAVKIAHFDSPVALTVNDFDIVA